MGNAQLIVILFLITFFSLAGIVASLTGGSVQSIINDYFDQLVMAAVFLSGFLGVFYFILKYSLNVI